MKFHGSIALAASLCLWGAISAPTSAQAREAAQLEPVVVTAGRVAENPKTVTQSMTVIPQEEIKKNQYRDLGDLLRNYGIQTNTYNPNNSMSRISIRGVSSTLMGNDLMGSVLIMVDGRRVGTDNVSMIPMVNIERIEIIRGPAAVQYGTSAIGGVVNIITRRGKEDLALSAEVGTGSWETYRAQGGVAGMVGPVDFSGGLSWLTARDYTSSTGGTYHNTDVKQQLAYSLNLGLNFLDEHRLGFKAMGTDYRDMGSPNQFQTDWESGGEFVDRYNYSYDLDYQGGYKDFGLSWSGRYFNGRQQDHTDDHEKLPYPTFTFLNEYQGAQGQVSFSKSFLTLTGGVDWLRYDGRESGKAYTGDDNTRFENLGVFALAKLSFFDDFVIVSGGLRRDGYEFKAGGNSTSVNRTTPSAGLALNPLDWLTLRANYGESFRIPSARETLGFPGSMDWGYGYGYVDMVKYIGNPDLKPEQGKTWDVGFDIHYESLNLGLTYFQTDYKDKIATVYNRAVSPSEMQYINLEGTTKYQGLEAQASYDAGDFFDWPFMLRPYFNLTHMLKFEDHEGNGVPNVSRNDLAYGVQFAHPDWGLDVDVRVTYYGHQRDGLNTIGDKTVADLFVTKTVWEGDEHGKLSVKGEVRNLFNEQYELMYGYPMPGVSCFVGLRYDY